MKASDVLTNTFDGANRLTQSERSGTTLQPIYNGVNDRVGQVTNGVTTTFALDVLGLPEVIYTSKGNAYLHLPGVIVAERSTGEVRYLLSDGLGSVRQAFDASGQVVSYHEFDPYGNPVEGDGEPYGYTGEWWEDEVGLLHLRARWYAPETGTFLSVDPVEGEPPYLYVGVNPINFIDPSGFSGEPSIPDQKEWTMAGGFDNEYSVQALERLVDHQDDDVAASQRHGFISQKICMASPAQSQLMYALAAIVYRESLGYDEDTGIQGTAEEYLSSGGIRIGTKNVNGRDVPVPFTGDLPSIGIGQIRPHTALDLERAGYVRYPYNGEGINTDPEYKFYGDSFFERLFQPRPYARVADRLSNPIWAIEYVAANMEFARTRPGYNSPQLPGKELIPEWERMASWHNRGVVNLAFIQNLDDRERIWFDLSQSYLPGTWGAMRAIEAFDLLGVKSSCDGSCGQGSSDK